MNINDITVGQIKEMAELFSKTESTQSLNSMIGKNVIIRTYSAGCWFGLLKEKSGNEVILGNARRMWTWKTVSGISLSACANSGINHEKSNIAEAVECVWLEAIEIIPCTDYAIKSIEGAENAKAR